MVKKYVYSNIIKAIEEKHETQRKIADVLGITDVGLRFKLSAKYDWTIGEIETLCKHFNKDYYELFKKEEE